MSRCRWTTWLAVGLLACVAVSGCGPYAASQPSAGDGSETEPQGRFRSPDVIFVPTPQDVVDKMLELAAVKKTDLVYDLGCGDGRIVVTAAKKYGCQAVGFDIDPKRIREANENVKQNQVGKLVQIKHDDIFTLDLSEVDVVTLYLLPDLNVKLIPQLKKLKPGSRIVSHEFEMKGVEPTRTATITPKGDRQYTVYLWVVDKDKKIWENVSARKRPTPAPG